MVVIITMAGLGSRFKKAGYELPKYMIEAKGKTLFEWSMNSLLGYNKYVSKYIFIVRKQDNARRFIEAKCEKYDLPQIKIVEIEHSTDGQATTCKLAFQYCDNDESIMIYNIDTYVEPYEMKYEDIKGDGYIPCFRAEGTHWSFAKINESGEVVEVREKERISDNCTLGAYYFKSVALYNQLYDDYYKNHQNMEANEKYIAPLYNLMIQKGMSVRIGMIKKSKVHVLGTPEELNAFLEEKKLTIMFSVPVHEKPEVVLDQICNLKYFNPNCGIVLHISTDFNWKSGDIKEKEFLSIIGRIRNVYINPNRLRSGLCDIIQCHISNFDYVSNVVDFHFFMLTASNELYIKRGLYKKIKSYGYGNVCFQISGKKWSQWEQGKGAHRDTVLKNIRQSYGQDKVYGAAVEGSFYNKEMMEQMCHDIKKYYDYKTMKEYYAREEVYFPSIAQYIKKDGIKCYKEAVTYMDWDKELKVDITDIWKNKTYFSVKRVNRDLYDVLRRYICQKQGNYFEVEKQMIPDLQKKKWLKIKNISRILEKKIFT